MNRGYFWGAIGMARMASRLFRKIVLWTDGWAFGGAGVWGIGAILGKLTAASFAMGLFHLLLLSPDYTLKRYDLGVGLVEELVGEGADVVTLLSHRWR